MRVRGRSEADVSTETRKRGFHYTSHSGTFLSSSTHVLLLLLAGLELPQLHISQYCYDNRLGSKHILKYNRINIYASKVVFFLLSTKITSPCSCIYLSFVRRDSSLFLQKRITFHKRLRPFSVYLILFPLSRQGMGIRLIERELEYGKGEANNSPNLPEAFLFTRKQIVLVLMHCNILIGIHSGDGGDDFFAFNV